MIRFSTYLLSVQEEDRHENNKETEPRETTPDETVEHRSESRGWIVDSIVVDEDPSHYQDAESGAK